MAAEKLKCKECGTDISARGAVCLRALLRPARGQLRPWPCDDVAALRRRIQGGPQDVWRYADFLPLAGRPARAIEPPRLQGGAARGLDAADQRRPACRSARPAGGVGQERRRQPDALLQGPRRRGRLGAGARARFRGARLRVDREPRQRRRRSGGGARTAVLRLHPGRPRGAEDPRNRRLRHEPRGGARQLRRREPPLHGAVGRARRLGLREHQHAPVLLARAPRRSPTRSSSSSAGSCPTAASSRSRRARCSPRSTAASPNGSSWGSSRVASR